MVTKSGELKTYYQRNWEDFQPYISGETWRTITHVAGLVLPIIGLLHKRAGRAISFTATSLNLILATNEFLTGKTWTYAHSWSMFKNTLELVTTFKSLRIGLAIHTAMNLCENFYDLRKFQTLTWSQTGQKMLPVVSNALYLLTLASFSTPVSYYGIIGASLVFQAGWSLYKARTAYKEAKTWTEMKILDAAAHAAMSVIFMTKARTAIEQYIEIQNKLMSAVQRVFVLMRPASKHDKNSPEGGLSQKGKDLAASKMPKALRQILRQTGNTHIVLYTSPAAHHKETASIIKNKWGESCQVMAPKSELREVTKPMTSQEEAYKNGQNLPPAEERWEACLDQDRIESPAQVASRIDGVIRKSLNTWPEIDVLPIFVTGGTAMKRYIQGEILKNPEIPESAARNIKDGGMRVVTMTLDENEHWKVTRVVAVDPKKMSA